MRGPLLAASSAMLLAGCSKSLTGDWVGQLIYDYDGYDTHTAFEAEISQSGSSLSGDVKWYVYGYYEYEGELDGSVSGKQVELDIEIDIDDYTFEINVDGDRTNHSLLLDGDLDTYDGESLDIELELGRK